MMKDYGKYISGSFSMKKDQLITALEGALSRHPHCSVMAKAIVNNLEKSPVGVEQLIKSFLGMEETTHFSEGDKVWVRVSHLPTWRFNKDLMQQKGLIFQDKIECLITDIDLYTVSPLTVKFDCYNDNGDEDTQTYTIQLTQAELSDSGSIDLVDDKPKEMHIDQPF